MRVAAISDVHGNLAALEAVFDDIARRSTDLVVNLGDCVSGPLRPSETAALLMSCGFPTIAGNHERQLLGGDSGRMGASDRYARETLKDGELEWLGSLPATLALPEGIFLCHGTPTSDLEYLLETVERRGRRAATTEEVEQRLGTLRAPLVLCGHSHVPRLLRLGDGSLVANPGSVGLQAFVWDQPHLHHVQTGSPDARYGLFERRDRRWVGEIVAVAYESDEAARTARYRRAGDWAEWLATGSVASSD